MYNKTWRYNLVIHWWKYADSGNRTEKRDTRPKSQWSQENFP